MMEECSNGGGEGGCSPKLLDLIPREMEWVGKRNKNGDVERSSVEIKKLELRLGLPGDDDDEWSSLNNSSTKTAINLNREVDHHQESLFSLGYFNNGNHHHHHSQFQHHHQQQSHNKVGSHEIISQQVGPATGASSPSVWFNQQQQAKQAPPPSFLQFPTTTTKAATDKTQRSSLLLPTVAKESSQSCCTKVGVVDLQQSPAEKKAFSPPAAPPTPANTAVPNSSQKRTAPGPVVGWPPIRSFRKNLASSSTSSKQQQNSTDSQNGNPNKKAATSEKKPVEACKKGMFVKINMDGVPIGRKVDLTAYDSYQRLSTAVDELFRGLLAAQRDSSAGGNMNKQQEQQEEEKAITGLLDGTGEYTLVYEDNEGDRMLVGDVPWHMFVSAVKRLRVLKSSDVSALSLGCSKQEKMVAMK